MHEDLHQKLMKQTVVFEVSGGNLLKEKLYNGVEKCSQTYVILSHKEKVRAIEKKKNLPH